MRNDIRVAAVICQSRVGHTEENLRRMEKWTEAAAKEKADIVCFPELCITGYHVRDEIRKAALPMTGAAVDTVIRTAGRHGITVVAGLAEKNENGRIYAAGFACNTGGLLGIYRKVHLAPPEKEVFSPAGEIGPLMAAKGFQFGIQLCYDAHFPGLATHMTAQGADALFIPHASPGKDPCAKKDSWMRHLPARAYDNGLFVIAVNACGDNGYGLHFPAAAAVFSPAGKIIASHAGAGEDMLVADLPRKTMEDVRNHRMRYFFPHRRPELYGGKP